MLMFDKEVDVSVVLPAYNEAERIGVFLNTLIDFVKESLVSYEIVVVADGCIDATREIVNKYSQVYPAVRLITFPKRLGKGGAIKLGFHNCRGRVFLYMDADGGYDPKEIPNLLRALDNADCVFGSRALPGSVSESPRTRRLAGYLYMRLVNFLLFKGVTDTQAGFKAFKRKVIDTISDQVSANGFDTDVQLLIRAKMNGFKLAEVPVSYRFVKGSKVNILRDGALMGLRVLHFWFLLVLERLGLYKIREE